MNRHIAALIALALLFPGLAMAATTTVSKTPAHPQYLPSSSVLTYSTAMAEHHILIRMRIRLLAEQVADLQGDVRYFRLIAKQRAAKVGITITRYPLTTNPVVLERQRARWKHLAIMYGEKVAAAQTAVQTVTVVPSTPYSGSLIDAFNCISLHEEYGVTGQNTSAGYFGMIYPPSAYPSPGPEYAAQYGDSWLDIPLSAQYQIAIAEQARYGWGPWTTAGACGLY